MSFLNRFLISPVTEDLYRTDYVDPDQLRFERTVRTFISKDIEYPGKVDYKDWNYYYKHGAIYVDRSTFYSMLTYVRFDAVTILESDKARTVNLKLWTYGSVSVFVNGEKVHYNKDAVYKPILNFEFPVALKEGRNEVYVVLQNLGVRDTRNLFGLELVDEEGITSTVPAMESGIEASNWLDQIVLDDYVLKFPSTRDDVEFGKDLHSHDYATVPYRYTWSKLDTSSDYSIPEDTLYCLVRIRHDGGELSRRFEVISRYKPMYVHARTDEENMHKMLERVAAVEGLSRGDKFAFYIPDMHARLALGIDHPEDEAHMYETLDQIEKRFDCSDFLIAGVIRYMKNYPVSEKLAARIKEVLLDYRFWMTMKGSDAMCFWSENHSVLFYSCAMIVGSMYPEEYFTRAEMTGKELYEFGKRLTLEWFDDLEKYGYEEFLSTVYMNITYACLINIYDYSEPEISAKAGKVLDLMMRELSLHTFDGAVIAPQGRVYRDVIKPCSQAASGLMNLVYKENPTCFGEGWQSFHATSSYRFPAGLKELMLGDADETYSTGDALLTVRKRRNYILTSVQSPRLDGFERWDNITLQKDTDKYLNTHEFTRSFNERFHGTTFFEPGTYGYQQHMWMAAVSNEAAVFANIPGDTYDSSSMRPGYWYGNGIMPAVRQDGSVLGCAYHIEDEYPIKFIHFFLPECKFDDVIFDGEWIHLRKNDGYLSMWLSDKAVHYNDELDKCELRVYSDDLGLFVFAGGKDEYGSFEDFQKSVKAHDIAYDRVEHKLSLDGKLFTQYVKSDDRTQYI